MLALIAALAVQLPIPPPMPLRDIGAGWDAASRTQAIQDGDVSFQLFVPDGVLGDRLTMHFHGAAWFAIDEHVARGLRNPLIVFNNGQGSSVYQRPFLDPARFRRWIALAEGAVREGKGPRFRAAAVDISSFSAGYGAVRELVSSPNDMALITRIVLCDSMYASHAADGTKRAEPEQIARWVPYALSAAQGERTLAFTYSQVPTDTYASSSECARALAQACGTAATAVEPGTLAATLDAACPLLARADKGHLHLWGYGGDDAPAHLTHVRHLADVWQALDRAGAP